MFLSFGNVWLRIFVNITTLSSGLRIQVTTKQSHTNASTKK